MRIWRGWTDRSHADTYQELVSEVVLPSIAERGLRGYLGAYLARRDRSDDVEFATVMLFDSIGAVREFAGEDYEVAYVPERAREVLQAYDERATHYSVLRLPDQTR